MNEELKYPLMRATGGMSDFSKTLTNSLNSSPKISNRSIFITKMRDRLKLKSSLHQSIVLPLSYERILSAPGVRE